MVEKLDFNWDDNFVWNFVFNGSSQYVLFDIQVLAGDQILAANWSIQEAFARDQILAAN